MVKMVSKKFYSMAAAAKWMSAYCVSDSEPMIMLVDVLFEKSKSPYIKPSEFLPPEADSWSCYIKKKDEWFMTVLFCSVFASFVS